MIINWTIDPATISLRGSKNHPYLPHGRNFSLDPSTSLEIPVKLQTLILFYLNFGAFKNPPPPGISNPFRGESEYGYFLELHNVKSFWCKYEVLSFHGPLSVRITPEPRVFRTDEWQGSIQGLQIGEVGIFSRCPLTQSWLYLSVLKHL